MNFIDQLNLKEHIEGGYFGVFYKSDDKIKTFSNRYGSKPVERYVSSSIYFLLIKTDFSAWHRLKSDEIWHYYEGASPLDIHVIDQFGNYTKLTLGNPSLTPTASLQQLIKAGSWFAAEVRDKNSFSLVGCTVAPAFEYDDFELAEPLREELITNYPMLTNIIDKFLKPSNYINHDFNNYKYNQSVFSATEYISHLRMKKHFGGGFFVNNYISLDCVLPLHLRYKDSKPSDNHLLQRKENIRPESTSEYYLLENEDFSAWHRLKSDQIWHYYDGNSAVNIYILEQSGDLLTYVLGNPRTMPGASFQIIIKANSWFAAETQKPQCFALLGHTTSPGLSVNDYEIASKKLLLSEYPMHKDLINKLTIEFSSNTKNQEKQNIFKLSV